MVRLARMRGIDAWMTDAERHFVIDGRRWRRTDPTIPERFRVELVAELMAARRAIGAGDRQPVARARVHDAKLALGERGEPWWDEPSDEGRRSRVSATIRALLRHRDGSSICPSDVARVVGGERWRSVLDDVRAVAADLAAGSEITVTQRGKDVDPSTARGPVRYRLRASDQSEPGRNRRSGGVGG